MQYTPIESTKSRNAGHATSSKSDKAMVVVAAVYVYGVFANTFPFFEMLPLPDYLKSNGMILSIALIVLVAFRSRLSFLELPGSRRFLPFITYAIVATAIMSLVLYAPLGTLYGDSTISASAPSYLWLSIMVLTLMALDYCFNSIGVKGLDVVFETLTVTTVVVGAIQVFAVIAGSPVYNALNSFGFFQDIFDGRISTISSEPSSNGATICMAALPFVLMKIHAKAHWRFKLYAIALLLLLYFVSSTQCFMAFLGLLIGCVLVYGGRGVSRAGVIAICLMGCALCMAVVVLSLSTGDILQSEPVQQLRYYLFEKIGDTSNASSINRYSTLINDLFVFLQFPLFGCGEGIQGFFFNQNIFAHWMVGNSVELADLLAGKSGVVGPGCFITAILSSFGLVGFALFMYGLLKNLLNMKRNQSSLSGYYEMVLMSLAAALPMGFVGLGFAGCWQLYVVLAIAFIIPGKLKKDLKY